MRVVREFCFEVHENETARVVCVVREVRLDMIRVGCENEYVCVVVKTKQLVWLYGGS